MIRRLFRTLARWCWAIYLVALIVWIVALVASFGLALNGTFESGDTSGCTLHEGAFGARLSTSHPYIASPNLTKNEIAFPGFIFTAANRPAYFYPTYMGNLASGRAYELRIDAWLITLALLTPVLAAVILGVRRNRRPAAIPRNRLTEVVRLLGALLVGTSLWLIIALVAFLLTTRGQAGPTVIFDVGTGAYAVAGLGAEVNEGSLVVTAGAYDHQWGQAVGFIRMFAIVPTGTPETKCPLWAAFALLAIAPLASQILGLRRAPHPPGCCRACGYDLRGSPASGDANGPAKCPECGWSGAVRDEGAKTR